MTIPLKAVPFSVMQETVEQNEWECQRGSGWDICGAWHGGGRLPIVQLYPLCRWPTPVLDHPPCRAVLSHPAGLLLMGPP